MGPCRYHSDLSARQPLIACVLCIWGMLSVSAAKITGPLPADVSEPPAPILADEPPSEFGNPIDGPPEPSTFALVGLGMTGLGLLRIRRLKRR